MELTEEQKERIRQNREKALAIQRQRKKDLEEQQLQCAINAATTSTPKKRQLANGNHNDDQQASPWKRKRPTDATTSPPSISTAGATATGTMDDLEPFEEGASEWVTKADAKKMYCLPEGTLAVCKVVEKANPRHKGWSTMKLYYRSELRQRAHKRYGGREGLVAERKKRENERFAKDLEQTKNIFQR